MDNIINIIDRYFNFLGQIDNYQSFIPTKKWHSIGSFELHLHEDTAYADKLQKENIIFTTSKKAYVILHREINSSDGKLVVKGLELKSYMSRWLVFPDEGQAYFRVNSDAETIMKEYAAATLNRKGITNIIVAPNQNRGIETVYQSRYKNLADELEKLSLSSGLGWDVTLDIENKKFIFDVAESENRTANQDILPPAIFSIDYDNIAEQTLIDSKMSFANIAVVAGQGEGTDREISIVGDTEGLDSFELFVDARDIQDSDDLPLRGEQKLSELKEIFTFDSRVDTNKNLKYEEDFNLGDLVTLQNNKWSVTIDRRITELTEIYESDGFRLDVIFGESLPGIIDKIKQITDEPIAEGGKQGEPGTPGINGSNGVGLQYSWNSKQLGIKREDEATYHYVNLEGKEGPEGKEGKQGPQGLQGLPGLNGKSLEFQWQGTQLGVRLEGQTDFVYVDLVGKEGPRGKQGIQGERGLEGQQGVEGPRGLTGKSLEFLWNGTQLGIRVEGDTSYQYVDLKGPEGPPGTTSWSEISGKPSTFPPSGHNHDQLISVDTRSLSTTPTDYSRNFKIQFKSKSAIDLNQASGTYVSLIGFRTWSDDSGGAAIELAYDNAGNIFFRYGTTSQGWVSWQQLAKKGESGGGPKIITSAMEPPDLVAGDYWYKEL